MSLRLLTPVLLLLSVAADKPADLPQKCREDCAVQSRADSGASCFTNLADGPLCWQLFFALGAADAEPVCCCKKAGKCACAPGECACEKAGKCCCAEKDKCCCPVKKKAGCALKGCARALLHTTIALTKSNCGADAKAKCTCSASCCAGKDKCACGPDKCQCAEKGKCCCAGKGKCCAEKGACAGEKPKCTCSASCCAGKDRCACGPDKCRCAEKGQCCCAGKGKCCAEKGACCPAVGKWRALAGDALCRALVEGFCPWTRMGRLCPLIYKEVRQALAPSARMGCGFPPCNIIVIQCGAMGCSWRALPPLPGAPPPAGWGIVPMPMPGWGMVPPLPAPLPGMPPMVGWALAPPLPALPVPIGSFTGLKVGCDGMGGACVSGSWEQIRVMPWECEVLPFRPRVEGPKRAAPGCADQPTCPYPAPARKQVETPAVQLDSILENLEKLVEARRLCAKAERCLALGHHDRAATCYRKVCELCPGTRYEMMASARLGQLAARRQAEESNTNTQVEEADPVYPVAPATPAPVYLPCEPRPEGDGQALGNYQEQFSRLLDLARWAVDAGRVEEARQLLMQAYNLERPIWWQGRRSAPDVCSEVAELVEAAQRAYAAGCHDDARDYVNRALTLDPSCIAALALVNKLDGCTDQTGGAASGDDEQSEPLPAPVRGTGLCPHMPPVDPQIIDALDRVLDDVDRPAAGDAQEQEEAEDRQIMIDPDDEDLELVDDACIPEQEPAPKVKDKARAIIQAIQKGQPIELEMDWPGGGKAYITLQPGGIENYLANGIPSDNGCVIRVVMPHLEDLRDQQLRHNEEVLDWIESMNSGGLTPGEDSHEAQELTYPLETDLGPDW